MNKPSYVFTPAEVGKRGYDDLVYQQSVPRWSTGIPVMDEHFNMFYEGRVIGIQASTSHGKSTLMLSLAYSLQEQMGENEVVLFATWEDSVELFAQRLMAKATRIPLSVMYGGGLTQDGLDRLRDAATGIQSSKLWIVGHSEYAEDHARLSMREILEAVKYVESQGVKVRAVFLDYLQRISLDDIDPRYRGNVERTQECVNKVKDLAIHTRAMVVIATQVDREIEKERKNKMPQKGDSQWSSNFEQTCDGLWSMYIPAKYYPVSQSLIPAMGDRPEIHVTPDLVMMQLQKDKLGKTPITVALSLDFTTGIFTKWEPE